MNDEIPPAIHAANDQVFAKIRDCTDEQLFSFVAGVLQGTNELVAEPLLRGERLEPGQGAITGMLNDFARLVVDELASRRGVVVVRDSTVYDAITAEARGLYG